MCSAREVLFWSAGNLVCVAEKISSPKRFIAAISGSFVLTHIILQKHMYPFHPISESFSETHDSAFWL